MPLCTSDTKAVLWKTFCDKYCFIHLIGQRVFTKPYSDANTELVNFVHLECSPFRSRPDNSHDSIGTIVNTALIRLDSDYY
jgi:hypothetical protein